jgi:hypothetical protein
MSICILYDMTQCIPFESQPTDVVSKEYIAFIFGLCLFLIYSGSCQVILFNNEKGGDVLLCLFTFTRLRGFNSHKTKLSSHSKFFQRYLLSPNFNTVTYRPISRQRLGKNNPAGANARYNRTSTARQWISKHAFLTMEAVFSAWSVRSGYTEVFSSIERSEESSLETPACRDMILGLN